VKAVMDMLMFWQSVYLWKCAKRNYENWNHEFV